MKKSITLLIGSLLLLSELNAQSVTGLVIDSETLSPLAKARISINHTNLSQLSDAAGQFELTNVIVGDLVLRIALEGYETQLIPISVSATSRIDVGSILLFRDIRMAEEDSGIISLTEDDLNNAESESENTTGLLQASKDVFQNRAAFDYSQAFFRVRGYDSQSALVLINGVSMNKLFNGRPQWSNWGGLNDVTRNQELTTGLAPSNHSFGAILGSTNISTRASKYRPGLRVSTSYANRTYTGRLMATYNSGLQKNNLAYTVSASRRWGSEGYIDGTLYDAYSFFGAFEYQLNTTNSINLTAFYTPNKRGSVSAITERSFNAMGRRYNPYWGYQDGKIRNTRIRTINEPLFMFSHFYESENTSLTTSIAYQIGSLGGSRLEYANAPNPNPNYWRYLLLIAEKPQVHWNNFYEANTNTLNVNEPGAARYLVYEDRTDDTLLTVSTTLNTKLSNRFSVDLGGTYKSLLSENYGNPLDLLGAEYYSDVNPFTLIDDHFSRNDALGTIEKGLNDRIKYNYNITATQLNAFAQVHLNFNKATGFLSGSYTNTSYQREGKFLNESFEANSLGKSEELNFGTIGFKAGLTYNFTGRHLLLLNAAYLSKAPTIRNSFVNSRENNNVVPNLTAEDMKVAEANYIYRSPLIKARLTGYYSLFNNGTDINFFFAQSGSGTDFFQEVVTHINKRHYGAELGFEFQNSPTVKTFITAAYGEHTYTSNATIGVNFDTAGYNEDLINTIGFKDLGEAQIEGLKIANGPQQAYTVGIEYRDPKYWWIAATANYLSHSYVDISTISRTNDFFINPEDPNGLPFESIDYDLAHKLLQQERFDGYYLLNLTGGKSWRVKGNYIGLFISVNNAFDEIFRTGGYEQSRTANYKDLVEDTSNGTDKRSFGNKYWYGLGRSYFVNIAFSF